MKFLFRIILNGIKYTGLLLLFMCFIVLSFIIAYMILFWYFDLWKTVDPSNQYLLLIIPFIVFIGLITTSIHSFLRNLFFFGKNSSEIDLDRMVEEIRIDLLKKNMI